MSDTLASPTARRWELAARLRALREEAGKSIEEVAAELLCSPAKVSRMETGGRGVQLRDIRDLCRFYGLDEAVQAELWQMATDARKPGWWADYRTIDEQTATYVGLETAATEIRQIESRFVSGLLQTADITRGILSGLRPPGELDDTWIEETIQLRARRQKRLLNGELRFEAVLDESAFMRRLASPQAHVAQLDHLIEVAELPTVTLRVMPFETGVHPGLEGPFQHLRFPSGSLDDIVYVEGLLGNHWVERSVDVKRYALAYRSVAEQALDPQATRDWLLARRQHEKRLRR